MQQRVHRNRSQLERGIIVQDECAEFPLRLAGSHFQFRICECWQSSDRFIFRERLNWIRYNVQFYGQSRMENEKRK